MSRTVLVTGASSGIGRSTVELFASKGWNVAATARSPEDLGGRAIPGRVEAFRLDVTDPASIRSAVDAAIARFGGVDVLVNNAGFALVGAFEALPADGVRRQFETNVFGLMETTRALLPHFRGRRSGVIVNVSSMGGRLAFPFLSPYHASKWAVEGFSESLYFELEPFGIRVKLIEPGVIKTDFYGRSMVRPVDEAPTPYDAMSRGVLTRMDRGARKGASPDDVARVIYRAATDGRRKLRYTSHAAAPLALRRLLPEWLFLAMIRAVLVGRHRADGPDRGTPAGPGRSASEVAPQAR